MGKLGDLLKNEREKRGLSLHEIGMSLKINSKVLKAIEEGDEANFPAKTFLRGFVKSYAQYLRLDTNQILQMFQEEFGSTHPEEPKKIETSTNPSVSASSVSIRQESTSLRRNEDSALPEVSNNRIYTIIGAIVLLMLIAFVVKMMDKYQKESRVSKSEVIAAVEGDKAPVENTDTDLPTAASGADDTTTTSTVTSTTLGGAVASPVVAISTTTTVKTTTTTVTTTTTLRPTTTSTTTVTTTTLRPTTTTTAKPSSTTTTTLVNGASTTTTLKGKNTEVILEALSKVSVKFSLNGGKIEAIDLSPDQVHTFRSRGNIQLEISDGGAVNIIVNGRDRGVPGTIGKSIKLSYP